VTCISIFTCTIRSDYNFAMGLLCYYLIKTAQGQKINQVSRTLLILNAITIVMDILWCSTMSSVWSGQPAKNPQNWAAFARIRSLTLFLSSVNIILKAAACVLLFMRDYKRLSFGAGAGGGRAGSGAA